MGQDLNNNTRNHVGLGALNYALHKFAWYGFIRPSEVYIYRPYANNNVVNKISF